MTAERTARWWVSFVRWETRAVLDVTALGGAFALAYLLRFDFELPESAARAALTQLPLVIVLQLVVLRLCGTHRFLWRHVGMSELNAFIRASVWSGGILLVLRLGLPNWIDLLRVPLSVIAIDAVLAHGGVLGLRVFRRWIYERFETERPAPADGERSKVLLIGAGRAGAMVARDRGPSDTEQQLIGFVDDDPSKRHAVVGGLEVLGTTRDLGDLIAKYEIDRVAITIADPDPKLVRRVVDECEPSGTRVQIIPGLYEILQGHVSVNRFRDVSIEHLLGRDPVQMDSKRAADFLSNKVVLVTGAGGSIGSEIARQVASFGPSRLLLVERAEGALFAIEQELLPLHPGLEIRALVGDVGHEARMRSILETYRPQVVFHAAAHKHVPMMESNPSEAIHNNVIATQVLGQLAGEFRVEAFVQLSTDKAVRPRSIMGASKRLAELVLEDLSERHPTRYVAVRFGNVLDSAGSVVPIFREQIRRGGPVTVTHPEATRYFMTIPEAVQLVLEAGAIGSSGDVMVLDMGEALRIQELAEMMIRLSGQASRRIEIVHTGLRPGEKLTEELVLDEEATDRTVHPRIFVGKLQRQLSDELQGALKTLHELANAGDGEGIRELLASAIPEADLEAGRP